MANPADIGYYLAKSLFFLRVLGGISSLTSTYQREAVKVFNFLKRLEKGFCRPQKRKKKPHGTLMGETTKNPKPAIKTTKKINHYVTIKCYWKSRRRRKKGYGKF